MSGTFHLQFLSFIVINFIFAYSNSPNFFDQREKREEQA